MGLCVSIDAAAVELAESCSTAKVVLPDGRLQEHYGGVSVRASLAVVHKDLSTPAPSAFFLCSADDLDADGRVAALAEDDELDAGQIYFVLPAHMRERRLMPEEMRELAVRAAVAITQAGGLIAYGNPYDDLVVRKKMTAAKKKATAAAGSDRRRGRGRGRDFATDLGAIPE